MSKPLKWPDVKALNLKIDEFFELCNQTKEVPTITGLAYHLGFLSRSSVNEYAQMPKYAASIKRAKLRVEKALEQRLASGKPPIGLIFSLKNNFGWNDKQDLDITSNGETLGVIALPQRNNAKPQ